MGMYVVKVMARQYVGMYPNGKGQLASISFGVNLENALMFESREKFDEWLDSGVVNCCTWRFWRVEGKHAILVPYAQEAADAITRLIERMA